MKYLPIAIKLKDKRVVVVGAGKVAERKVYNLLDSGAEVYIVSPRATRNIRRLVKSGTVKWIARPVARSDVREATLIVSATDRKDVNRFVKKWADEFQIPVNVVDNSKLSDFISPALLRFRKALIAVYTDGQDPVLSRDLKNYLKEHWDGFVSYRNRL